MVYTYTDNLREIEKFRGSKYVQADVGLSFRHVREQAETGRHVLFIGCPCQVAGLKAYLNKDYENIIVVDLLCHGVPSNKMWRGHLGVIAGNRLKVIDNIKFRTYDSCSLKLVDKFGKVIMEQDEYEDEFVVGFVHGLIFRKSCYQCRWASTQRIGDITLGDFWGLGKYDVPFGHFTDMGVNFIMVNTKKGMALLGKTDHIFMEERTLKEAMMENTTLRKPSKEHMGRKAFEESLLQGKSFENAVRYAMPEEFSRKFIRNAKRNREWNGYKNRIKHMVGIRCTEWIKRVKDGSR